jgi:hypothetical protein
MRASATSHWGHRHRSLRLPSEGGACLRFSMMSAWGWIGKAAGLAYHVARELDFRAQQCGCGNACSHQRLDHL